MGIMKKRKCNGRENLEGGYIKMKFCEEFEILKGHGDMYTSDNEKNILIPLENATPEVREAIDILNKKMNS